MTESSIKWNIRSFAGVGPISFGMHEAQVHNAIGRLSSVKYRDNEPDGSVREHRERDLPICNYLKGRLTGVDTTWRTASLSLHNVYLYQIAPIDCLTYLERINGNAKIYLNLLLFDNIGVTANGFYFEKENRIFSISSAEKDKRRIGAYQRGAFDEYIKKFEVISFV